MTILKKLKVLDADGYKQLTSTFFPNFIEEYYAQNMTFLNILEAGCGRKWPLEMRGIPYRLTGVDISREALEIRAGRQQDLDEAILGDLRTVKLNDAEYDLIYSSYVLEHIDGSEEILDKFFRWLKPNGLLILIIPDRNSVSGALTRITPFWLHILYYKYVKRAPRAGKAGYGPFPTSYDKVISRQGIHDYCRRHNYKILVEYGKESDAKRDFRFFYPFFNIFSKLLEIVSFRKIKSDHAGLIYVIQNSC